MFRALLIAVLVVIALPAAQADETDVGWDYATVGDSTIYTYILMSGSAEDIVTSFHVYAPCDYRLITDWSADAGWGFEALRDEETGGTDLNWYCPIGVADGLSAGGMLTVSVTTSSSVPTNEEYVLPGCLGNWGYEVAGWAGSVAIMPSSVAVPQSIVSTPEPSTLAALGSGLMAVMALRRKRK